MGIGGRENLIEFFSYRLKVGISWSIGQLIRRLRIRVPTMKSDMSRAKSLNEDYKVRFWKYMVLSKW